MKKLLSMALALVMVVSLTIPTAWASGGADSSVTNGAYEDGVWYAGGNGTAHYADDATGLDLDLSKTAKPVEGDPTAFDVTLQLQTRMTTTTTPPGSAATVLVFDRSDSMTDRIDGTTRLAAAKKAAVDFINGTGGKPGYKGDTPGTGRYLALVVFAKDAETMLSGWVDVSVPSQAAKVVNTINGLGTKGQTNHDEGLRKASDLLKQDIVSSIPKEQKNVIMLTDGKPTYSHSYGKRDGERMIKETADTAASLRQKAQIYTICFAAQNEKCYSGSSLTVGEFLRTKIATPATSSQKYAYNADNVNELNAAFAAITQSVVSGVNGAGWVVTDPMGKDVVLDRVISKTGKTQTAGNTLKWTIGNPVVTQDGAAKVYTYTLVYRVQVNNTGADFDEDVFHPLNRNTYVTIGGKQYAFPVPGVKVEAPRCTITYQANQGGSLKGADSDGKVIHTQVRKGTSTPAAPQVVCEEGYYFTGWTPAIESTVTGDATYTAQFAEKQTLTVQAKSGTFTYDGENHTVSGFEKTSFVIDGKTYTVEGLTATGSTEFGTAKVTVSGTAKVMQGSKDVTNHFTVVTKNGKITVNARPVTLTSQSVSRLYNGQPLQNTEIQVGGMGFAQGESFVYSDFASLTNVGSVKNTFKFAAGPNTDLEHYVVTVNCGELTVNRNTSTIVITAASDSKTYDGQPLTNSGFSVTEGELVPGDEVVATVEGTITNAGEAVNAITNYKVMRGDEDVTANYSGITAEDGLLTVTKRDVTLTSADAQKVYDGQPLTAETVTVGGDGFVKGQGARYSDFASRTDAGEVDNTFSYQLNDKTLADNYNITKNYGTLTVTSREQQLLVKAGSAEKVYDGQPLTMDAYTCTPHVLADGDKLVVSVEGSATHVGDEGINEIVSVKIMRGEVDVSENYAGLTTEDGQLTITKRDVFLRSDSAVEMYDGQPLTAETVFENGPGFVEGEGATYSNFASITDVGQVDNTFDYTLNSNTRSSDYCISVTTGMLRVNPVTFAITITAASESKMYDGQPLTNDGYTVDGGIILANGDELVVSVEGSATHVGDEGVNKITGVKVMRGEVDATANYTGIQTVDGKLTITKRDVTLTSDSAHKDYDGLPLTAENVTESGSGFIPDEWAEYSDFASITYVGSVDNTFTYTLHSGTEAEDYDITVKTGMLVVDANQNEIVITAGSASKVYDGTALTQDKYTFNKEALAQGDVLTAVVKGTITNAGKADNTVFDYKIMHGDKDVSAYYPNVDTVPGLLTVTPRDVTLTSASDSKVYDGQPLMADRVEAVGFVEGEGAVYSDFASRTDVGSTENTFSYAFQENTLAENYQITVANGTLTVTPVTGELVITAASDSKTYDGLPLTNSGFSVTEGVLIPGDQVVATVEGTITNAGEAINTVTDYKVMRGDVDVTANYTGITTGNGLLTVTKRDVTLTSASDSKIYDGQPLMADRVEAVGFAEGEGAQYMDFASITDVGQTENSFAYALDENTLADNYNITVVNGILTVNRYTDAKLQATGYTGVYDGAAHDGVTGTAIVNGVEGDEWVYTYSTDGETFADAMPQFKDVGTYTVYVKASNDNYEGDALTVAVTVTITPAAVVVTADSHTIATGDAEPTLSFTVDAPVDGETPAFTGSLVRDNGNGKGSYAIRQGTLALTDGENFLADNYVLEFVPGELTILQRALEVTKTADKAEVTVGGKIVYTITVKNTGEVDLTNVIVTDEMLDVEETIASLAVGEMRTFRYTYTTTKADEGKTLVNAVTVTADGGVTEAETAETEVIPAVPDTGDQSTMGLWIALLLLAAAGLVVLVKTRKKSR